MLRIWKHKMRSFIKKALSNFLVATFAPISLSMPFLLGFAGNAIFPGLGALFGASLGAIIGAVYVIVVDVMLDYLSDGKEITNRYGIAKACPMLEMEPTRGSTRRVQRDLSFDVSEEEVKSCNISPRLDSDFILPSEECSSTLSLNKSSVIAKPIFNH